ncbi:hypothetical protein [Chitinophaga agri]|uniref:Uncharacterized protein n=1 Tax=Chitinophaga agri TaxID=2703787 RepID=A0A6B9ZLT4_9BACT|nr:hypothetical protein [Chitinophaga agri]QHS63348.1 hypothetical protein GWR21_28300 [Chitinophaga agri]
MNAPQTGQKKDQPTSNLLNELHLIMTHLPVVLRDRICEECGWSIPTYYRKCRTNIKGEKAYSNAEEEMILRVHLEILKDAIAQVDRYSKV